MKILRYSVKTLRKAGLEARWGHTRSGAPILFARDPNASLGHQRRSWWAVDNTMWQKMHREGVLEGFRSSTALGHIFSVSV